MTNTILTRAEAALAHEEPLFADVGGDIAVSFEFFPPKTEKMDAQLWMRSARWSRSTRVSSR